MQYVQREVFTNYLNKDYEFLNNTYLGTLGTQAARLRESLDEYDQILFNGVTKQFIVVVASITIIAYQSLLLALVTTVTMVLVLSFTIAITKWRIKYRRLLSEASSKTAGVIGDALGNAATVKSFAAEDYEKQRLNSSLAVLANTQYRSWMSSIPADIGRMILATAATILLLLLTAKLYKQGSISIAIVVLLQLYVIKLVVATQDIADLYPPTIHLAHFQPKLGGSEDEVPKDERETTTGVRSQSPFSMVSQSRGTGQRLRCLHLLRHTEKNILLLAQTVVESGQSPHQSVRVTSDTEKP